MGRFVGRMALLTHAVAATSAQALRDALSVCERKGVRVFAPGGEFEKHGALLSEHGVGRIGEDEDGLAGIELCLVLGGDGTMLRAFQLTRGHSIPVAGVNLGRVGFLTTVDRERVVEGVERLLAGEFSEHPLLGLEADTEGRRFPATNDVVVCKGERPDACSLALTLNGVTLFEVQCDGVVVGTPAGSSAYSLAAGGPLLGISLDAYVITLVAAHAVGVRPVVAAPLDVLEIINQDDHDCSLDVDGQRMLAVPPGGLVRICTTPAMSSLALLEGDSLYHHFRDRLL